MNSEPQFDVRLASSEDDLRAAQRLRYEVFVAELGGGGALVDHDQRLERDVYDPVYDHLLLIDKSRLGDDTDGVVGVYRLMTSDRAAQAGQFYSEDEYDIAPLKATGRSLMELGRSCVHADYRGGPAMMLLWSGLGDYVVEHQIELMFGVASFHGTDVTPLKQPLALLHHSYLAPPELRVRVLPEHFQSMDLLPPDQIDRVAAMKAIPSLIKGYLRIGGFVGEGAFIDHAFNTTDVFLLMDTQKLSAKHARMYTRGRGVGK